MLAPKSWLQEYVEITLPHEKLAERLTEVGLNTEKIEKIKNDVVFDIEITPNRPDLLSELGIAREIAAIEGKHVKYPQLKTDLKPGKDRVPISIKTNPVINPRFTAIIIDGITVKDSPSWLKERLEKIGQRSINNVVDITNYVMYELGNPIHAFDYDRIEGKEMVVMQAEGGETFKSVDGITYHLPEGAVIIKDKEKIIDLCGIKGGYTSGTFPDTKTILLRVPVEIPVLIRRASQRLSLRSDASSIFERAVNAGGTVDALKRCVDLILELAGGHIASNLIDLKEKPFTPWHVSLRLERLHHILGITISKNDVLKILSTLNLQPTIRDSGQALRQAQDAARMTTIQCVVPTYRNDLQIEEDLVEEVARIYGYNNFPKTLPVGAVPISPVPYVKDYIPDQKAKQILTASGFSEIYTYSLLSEQDLETAAINSETVLRVDNPVSKDYEYLRPTLTIGLGKALQQNKGLTKSINLFELGKVYLGKTIDRAEEVYHLSGITNQKNFYEVKGIIETLFTAVGIDKDPSDYIEPHEKGIFFEIPYTELLQKAQLKQQYVPIPKYPPVIEDITLVTDANVPTGEIIARIRKQNKLITDVSLLDQYKNTRTFHIIYQDPEKNLTTEEVRAIREKMFTVLEKTLKVTIKQ